MMKAKGFVAFVTKSEVDDTTVYTISLDGNIEFRTLNSDEDALDTAV